MPEFPVPVPEPLDPVVPVVPPESVDVPLPVVEPVVLPVVPPEPLLEPLPLAFALVFVVDVNTACCVATAISDAACVTLAATVGGRFVVPVTLTGVIAVI